MYRTSIFWLQCTLACVQFLQQLELLTLAKKVIESIGFARGLKTGGPKTRGSNNGGPKTGKLLSLCLKTLNLFLNLLFEHQVTYQLGHVK